MNTIKEITKKIFSIDFEKDFENEDVYNEYINIADNLIKNNNWINIYECWYDYLVNECKTEEQILNYANLFWCYEGQNYKIPNAIEFCSFFYANISFEHYPDADVILDSISYEVLKNSGIYAYKEIYYDEYIPLNDPVMIKAIKKWKENKN